VQIVYKRGRDVVGIKHIGSAHNQTEIDILVAAFLTSSSLGKPAS